MTLAELASVPEHGRDFSSPALVGEHQLRQQWRQPGDVGSNIITQV
jgi:hypothetical protein